MAGWPLGLPLLATTLRVGVEGLGVLPSTACTDRTRHTTEAEGAPSSRAARYLSVTALRYSM